ETARQILEGMVQETGMDGQRVRLEAAKLLGELPDCFDPLLSILVRDHATLVVRAAIRSVGKLRKRRMVPDLLDLLPDQELSDEVAEALGQLGDSVVGALQDHIGDTSVPISVRRDIPRILVKVGSWSAARVLHENLLERDTTLRFRIISALNKLHRL